jgi:hypothetical protein
MKVDHPPLFGHGKAPSFPDHKMHHETIKGHAAGHAHHSEHYKKHAAGHTPHNEHVAKMCGGGMTKGK